MSDDERIEQLELENKVLKDNNKGLKDKIDELQKELDKKDKVINELCIEKAQRILYDSKEEEIQKYAEELKQKYFKKVEEENE